MKYLYFFLEQLRTFLLGVVQKLEDLMERIGSQKMLRKKLLPARTLPPDPVFPYQNISLQKIIAREGEIEEAALFLVHALSSPLKQAPKKGKKPVVLHSMRVGFWLMARGYPAPVVVAGILHDVLEKTEITAEALSRRFGAEIAAMVAANTVVKSDIDGLGRYRESVRRCAAFGPGALQVRAADLIDNCERQLALGNLVRLQRIHSKFEILLKIASDYLKDGYLLSELRLRESLLKELIDRS